MTSIHDTSIDSISDSEPEHTLDELPVPHEAAPNEETGSAQQVTSVSDHTDPVLTVTKPSHVIQRDLQDSIQVSEDVAQTKKQTSRRRVAPASDDQDYVQDAERINNKEDEADGEFDGRGEARDNKWAKTKARKGKGKAQPKPKTSRSAKSKQETKGAAEAAQGRGQTRAAAAKATYKSTKAVQDADDASIDPPPVAGPSLVLRLQYHAPAPSDAPRMEPSIPAMPPSASPQPANLTSPSPSLASAPSSVMSTRSLKRPHAVMNESPVASTKTMAQKTNAILDDESEDELALPPLPALPPTSKDQGTKSKKTNPPSEPVLSDDPTQPLAPSPASNKATRSSAKRSGRGKKKQVVADSDEEEKEAVDPLLKSVPSADGEQAGEPTLETDVGQPAPSPPKTKAMPEEKPKPKYKKNSLAAILAKTQPKGTTNFRPSGLSKRQRITSLHRDIKPPPPKPPMPKSKRRPDSDDDGEEFLTPAQAARRKRIALGLESDEELPDTPACESDEEVQKPQLADSD